MLYICVRKEEKAAIEKEKIRLLKENQYAESLDCIEYNNKKISYLEELCSNRSVKEIILKSNLCNLKRNY